MRVIAIIQARLGSTRLPRKVLATVGKRPLVTHVIERALAIKGVDEVILNIPEADAPEIHRAFTGDLMGMEEWAKIESLKTYLVCPVPHQERDVLRSYCHIATDRKADVIMRLTGDCPLLDPQLCTSVLTLHLALGMATGSGEFYCANDTLKSGYPDGTDCEVVSADALRWANREALESFDREHVMPFLRKHLPCYGILAPFGTDLHHRKWSVDTAEDLYHVRKIMAKMKPGEFGWRHTRDVEDDL